MSQRLNPTKAKNFIMQDLKATGFDEARLMAAGNAEGLDRRLRDFIDQQYHGEMTWMAETMERRASPQNLWPEAQSIIFVAMRYGPDDDYDPLEALSEKSSGTISCYAHNRDYHDVIKGKLKQVAGRFVAKTGAQVKVFVDTAPVMEKPLAQKAGLGWQGKHTNLVSRTMGSWFFLGSIFTDLELVPDEPEIDHCGSCRSCLDVCPTNAFPEPYRLDARRCISYLTIEHAGPIAHEFRAAMGNRIYGCDDCLAVCPWNKFAQVAGEVKLQARQDMKSPELRALLTLDDTSFRARFSGSPIKRIGRDRLIRNCLIAAGNSKNTEMMGVIAPHLNDANPIVRGAAVWAVSQLATADELSQLSQTHYDREQNQSVREEWQAALDDR